MSGFMYQDAAVQGNSSFPWKSVPLEICELYISKEKFLAITVRFSNIIQ